MPNFQKSAPRPDPYDNYFKAAKPVRDPFAPVKETGRILKGRADPFAPPVPGKATGGGGFFRKAPVAPPPVAGTVAAPAAGIAPAVSAVKPGIFTTGRVLTGVLGAGALAAAVAAGLARAKQEKEKGYKKGGRVKKTERALVHKGEYVLPKGVKPTKKQVGMIRKKKMGKKKMGKKKK